jgi:hypothetical protein
MHYFYGHTIYEHVVKLLICQHTIVKIFKCERNMRTTDDIELNTINIIIINTIA